MNVTRKTKRIKNIIRSEGYAESRAKTMNNEIYRWKDIKRCANTAKERKFCDEMIDMYLKRYIFYVRGTTIMPVEDAIPNSYKYATEEETLNELNNQLFS